MLAFWCIIPRNHGQGRSGNTARRYPPDAADSAATDCEIAMEEQWLRGLPRLARALDGMDGPAVAACEGIPAHDGQFLEHLQSVAQVADAGTLVVRPADRD